MSEEQTRYISADDWRGGALATINSSTLRKSYRKSGCLSALMQVVAGNAGHQSVQLFSHTAGAADVQNKARAGEIFPPFLAHNKT